MMLSKISVISISFQFLFPVPIRFWFCFAFIRNNLIWLVQPLSEATFLFQKCRTGTARQPHPLQKQTRTKIYEMRLLLKTFSFSYLPIFIILFCLTRQKTIFDRFCTENVQQGYSGINWT